MKKIWFFLISVLVLAACSDEIPESPTPKVEGRTLLAYIVSNNKSGDLDKYLKSNVVDMYKGLAEGTDSVALLVYYRPKYGDLTLKTPSILKYVADGKGHINGRNSLPLSDLYIDSQFSNAIEVAELVINEAEIHPYENVDQVATDPAVMTQVLQDMINLVPSGSYGLTMGSHGTGWLEGSPVKGRSFGDDGGYNINIPELASVLKTAFANQKLDYILFDACMMANAEVAYELREVTDYIIASVLETPVYGFPYSRILTDLYATSVNYQQICDEFIAFNQSLVNEWGKHIGWGTVSVMKCSEMQHLADWVKTNLSSHKEKLTTDFPKHVMQYGGPFFRNYSFDLVDVFRQLEGSEPIDLKNLMNKVVIAKNCLDGPDFEFGGIVIDRARYSGLGMYLPYLVDKPNWDTYYMESLTWPKAIEWNYRP